MGRCASLRFKISCLHWRAMAKAVCKLAAIDELEAALARDATREKLLADAAKVWGSCTGGSVAADKENAPAQVISLVGMSAESLRAAACSRGVRAGVEIQVVGHQCLEKWNGEYAVL